MKVVGVCDIEMPVSIIIIEYPADKLVKQSAAEKNSN